MNFCDLARFTLDCIAQDDSRDATMPRECRRGLHRGLCGSDNLDLVNAETWVVGIDAVILLKISDDVSWQFHAIPLDDG